MEQLLGYGSKLENAIFVSVVILNWNGRKYLKKCLDSIANQSYKPREVIVVDNGSVDGSQKFLRENYPWVKLIETRKNLGSSEGHNVGIRATAGDYIAILDNDVYLDFNWILEEVRALSLEGIGIAGGMVKSYHPPHHQVFFPNRFFPSTRLPWAILSYALSEDKIIETDTVQSAAMMIRKEVIEKVGMLDRSFFFWNEDIDLCLRVKQASFKIVYNPKAIAYHKIGGLKNRIRSLKNFLAANIRFARKSYSMWQFPLAMLSVAISNILFSLLKWRVRV